MTERNIKYLIGGAPYFPTIHLKIDKGGKFLYCITLYILRGAEAVQICHCDNCHTKGHHIHFFLNDGTEKQKIFNFESISKTIEYLKNNCEDLMNGVIE